MKVKRGTPSTQEPRKNEQKEQREKKRDETIRGRERKKGKERHTTNHLVPLVGLPVVQDAGMIEGFRRRGLA